MSDSQISFDVLPEGPIILVISGISGVGKDTVLHEMKRRGLPFHFVVTTTSRERRANERDGVDYHFVSQEEYDELVATGQMAEYARVYGQSKGVTHAEIRQAFESGVDVVMRLNVDGAMTIRSQYPDAVLVFLVPASYQHWMDWLKNRENEANIDLKKREEDAAVELQSIDAFDYVVCNNDGKLSQTVDQIEAIITAEHCRTSRRKKTS